MVSDTEPVAEVRPETDPAAGTVRRRAIGTKLTIIAATIALAGLFAVAATGAFNARDSLIANETRAFVNQTTMLAANVNGGVRWNKPDVVQAAYSDLIADPNSAVASIRTWNGTGEEVTTFDSASYQPVELSDALTASQSAGEGVILERVGHDVIVSVPTGFAKDGSRTGTLAMAWSLSGVEATIRDIVLRQALTAAVVVVLLVVALVVVSRRMVGSPLARLTETMEKLRDGNTEVEIAGVERRDELGTLAGAMVVWRERLIECQALQAELISREESEERNRRRAELVTVFDRQVREVLDAFQSSTESLDRTAQDMGEISRQTSDNAGVVGDAADQTTSSMSVLASATEELSASINEIAQQVQEAARVSEKAVEDVGHTDETMRSLDQVARRVGEVVKIISDIAEQTNLLALNATIEAARAGEAGRGFAVVATEVKNLASQTAAATEEVEQQVSAIQQAASNAVESMSGVTGTIERMQNISEAIAAAVEEQSASTSEISKTVHATVEGARGVREVICGVTDGAGRTDQAARAVLDSGSVLSEQAMSLRKSVESFLSEISAINASGSAQKA